MYTGQTTSLVRQCIRHWFAQCWSEHFVRVPLYRTNDPIDKSRYRHRPCSNATAMETPSSLLVVDQTTALVVDQVLLLALGTQLPGPGVVRSSPSTGYLTLRQKRNGISYCGTVRVTIGTPDRLVRPKCWSAPAPTESIDTSPDAAADQSALSAETIA
jgi:hypothetical protein